jgi:hypothetical protein
LFKILLIIARDLMSLSPQLFPLPMLVARNVGVLIIIWIVVEETNLIYIPLIIDQTVSFLNNNVDLCFHIQKYVSSNFGICPK